MRRLLLSVLIIAACDGAISPDALELSFLVVSGDGQSGIAGGTLPQPLVIRATDSRGKPMRNLPVAFRVTSGGGSATPRSATTNQQGYAQTVWTLGTSTAVAQALEARAVSSGQLFGAFTATALPGPAVDVAIQAGQDQAATHDTPVAIAPAIKVTDRYANPISGVSVTFAIESGGGTVTGDVAATGADGIATVGSWTLGSSLGENTLTATVTGLPTMTFSATAVAGSVDASRSTVTAVPDTIGASDGAVASTITVVARDVSGYPVVGATVLISATGGSNTLTQPPAVTDAGGVATGSLASTAPGPKLVSAVIDGVDITQTATVTVTAGPPASLLITAGNNQSAVVGNPVPVAPSIRLTDAFGNPVAGGAVTFTVTSGGGRLAGTSPVPTGSDGSASVGWLVGEVGGTNVLTATAAGAGISGNPATFTAQAIGDVWTSAAPLSAPRAGLGAATIDGKVYAVGGSGLNFGRILQSYDPTTNSWTTKAPMPTWRSSPGVGAVGGILYVVGGWTGGVSGAVEAYDPVSNTWTAKAPLPTPRYRMAVAVVDGVLYAIGGYSGTLVCEPDCGWVLTLTATVEAYDPATDSWSTKVSLPTPRNAHAAAELNGIIYAVGGRSADNNSWLATVDAYDPTTDTWTPRASMPTGRFALGAGAVGGKLYAMGGEIAPNTVISTVEQYDPATDAWTTKAPLPRNREWFGAAVSNGLLYVVGGQSYIVTGPDSCVCQVPDVNVYHHP